MTHALLFIVATLVTVASADFKRQIDHIKIQPQQQLIFLLDGSSSVGESNFISELNFVKKLLSDFEVSENKTRVSLVVYGTHARLYEQYDKCELLQNVLPDIGYPGGGTNTFGAFVAARETLSEQEIPKVVFLITDGFSNGGDPVPVADQLKDANVTIFTIGIHSGNRGELNKLATTNETSYLLTGFTEFDGLARRALHADLHDGNYVPVERVKCGGRCDLLAVCTCGTSSGQYACKCPPGHYGDGEEDQCVPCPPKTYYNSGTCRPCPDINHVTNPETAALSVRDCKCKEGYKETDAGTCDVVRCPELKAPPKGYFVSGSKCPNIFHNACGVRCQVGYSLRGNSIRVCQENGSWTGIEPQCHLRTCSKPPVPTDGNVTCMNGDLDLKYEKLPDQLPVDTECTFSCKPGYSLAGSHSRTCLPVEKWDGLRTSCKPVRCPRLFAIPNGKPFPESCSKGKQVHGTNCSVICNEGFNGPKFISCSGDGTWSKTPKCVDDEPPKLECPSNLTIFNEYGENYGIANWTEPLIIDSGKVTVWWEPNLDDELKFEIGITVITYHAVDKSGNEATCNFTIEVLDIEPPRFIMCESPAPFLVNDTKGAYIEWDEPVALDNSVTGVTIEKSHQYGVFGEGTTTIVYSAKDKSDNAVYCDINVTVTVSNCDKHPLGATKCEPVPGGVLCVLTCEEGYAFAVTDTASCTNENPLWEIPDCTPTELPEQMLYTGEVGECEVLDNYCKDGLCHVLECQKSRKKRSTERYKFKITSKPDADVQKTLTNVKGVVITDTKLRCKSGAIEVAKKKKCVKCPKGFYQVSDRCERCPLNTYQDRPGSDKCIACPEGTGTRSKTAARNSRSCRLLCPPGTKMGPTGSCVACEPGEYQPGKGQVSCLKCPSGSTRGAYRCIARRKKCKDGDCVNGKCVSVGRRQKCECHEGFIGNRCRVRLSKCRRFPCLNGGTCVEDLEKNTYSCECVGNFAGLNCELEHELEEELAETHVNICDQIPDLCENGGSCFPTETASFKCICTGGFLGKRCNILPCDFSPCSRDEKCINLNGTDQIVTKQSYKCQQVDLCGCINGGACVNGKCLCPKNFRGDFCEITMNHNYVITFPRSSVNDFIMVNFPNGFYKQISMCAWINTNDTSNYGTIISYANSKHDNAFTVTDYSGLVIYVNGEHVVTDVVVNDGIWHHLCVVWNNGVWKIWVDFKLRDQGQGLSKDGIEGGGKIVLGQEQDILGGSFSRTESFVGKLSYVDVWNDTLKAISHSCSNYEGGNLISWPEFKVGLVGYAKIEQSHFCKQCTLPERQPEHGTLKIDSKGNLLLECEPGYTVQLGNELFSNTTILKRKCLASSQWEYGNVESRCNPISCGHPPEIAHGRVVRGWSFTYKDQITYGCVPGFVLNGSQTITCDKSGKWFGELPECQSVDCSPFWDEQANVTIVSKFNDVEGVYSLGTIVHVSCGGQEELLICKDDGWEGTPPECPKKECDGKDLSPPINGYIPTSANDEASYVTGYRIYFKCRNGHELQGLNYTECDNGEWTEFNGTCKPIKCVPPPKHPNMNYKNGLKVKEYYFGNMVHYECIEGYKFFGKNDIRCLSNGRWTKLKGQCTRISCNKPEVAEDETVIGNSYLYGETLNIKCPDGSINKSYNMSCSKSGKWIMYGDCTTERNNEYLPAFY